MQCDKFAAGSATLLPHFLQREGHGDARHASTLKGAPIQVVFFQQPLQGATRLAGMLCRAADVALVSAQEIAQIGPLKLLDGSGFGRTKGVRLRLRVLIRTAQVDIT
jgi:hypothetical protein